MIRRTLPILCVLAATAVVAHAQQTVTVCGPVSISSSRVYVQHGQHRVRVYDPYTGACASVSQLSNNWSGLTGRCVSLEGQLMRDAQGGLVIVTQRVVSPSFTQVDVQVGNTGAIYLPGSALPVDCFGPASSSLLRVRGRSARVEGLVFRDANSFQQSLYVTAVQAHAPYGGTVVRDVYGNTTGYVQPHREVWVTGGSGSRVTVRSGVTVTQTFGNGNTRITTSRTYPGYVHHNRVRVGHPRFGQPGVIHRQRHGTYGTYGSRHSRHSRSSGARIGISVRLGGR